MHAKATSALWMLFNSMWQHIPWDYAFIFMLHWAVELLLTFGEWLPPTSIHWLPTSWYILMDCSMVLPLLMTPWNVCIYCNYLHLWACNDIRWVGEDSTRWEKVFTIRLTNCKKWTLWCHWSHRSSISPPDSMISFLAILTTAETSRCLFLPLLSPQQVC